MFELLVKLVADVSVVIIAVVTTIVLLRDIPNKRKFEAYARILMAGLTAYLVAKLVASVYQPALERPFEVLGVDPGASYLDNPGFPSDHALFAMTLVLAVWFETKRRHLVWVLLGLTILMCVGRVLALVHTPLDVIGGLLIALTGIVWYEWRPLRFKKAISPSRTKNKISVK
jgi:membrane-associated phospholipid phosphatase